MILLSNRISPTEAELYIPRGKHITSIVNPEEQLLGYYQDNLLESSFSGQRFVVNLGDSKAVTINLSNELPFKVQYIPIESLVVNE